MAAHEKWNDDLAHVNNAAKQAAKAAKNAKKDAKAAASVVKQAVAGNGFGAVMTALKNPRMIMAAVAILLVLIILPITFVGVFLIEYPGAIINSITAAVTAAYDDLVVGWETLKIKVSNGIDDFLTWLTTGESGTASETFATDVAAAQDLDFEAYVGTSNALVAVLNEYFREEYESGVKAAAQTAGFNRELELLIEAADDGILPEDITSTREWVSNDQDYLDWTFTVIACDSVNRMYETSDDPPDFSAAALVSDAKYLTQHYSLWEVGVRETVTDGTTTRTVSHDEWQLVPQTVPVIDPATGLQQMQPQLDEDGNPVEVGGEIVMEPVTQTVEVLQVVTVTEEQTFPTRRIEIECYATPSPDAEDYILTKYGITDTADEGDLSDLAIVQEQVLQLRQLYSLAIGELTASGTILEWINDFYANHGDLVFAGPSSVAWPIENWRSMITSHYGSVDIAEHAGGHGGTDISSPSGTQLVLPAQGVAVAVTNCYANAVDYSHPRGNLVLMYYGEKNGVPGQGIFVLYQHMAYVTAAPFTLYDAGAVVGASGTSGMCTGPHWHIETYEGTVKTNPETNTLA